MKRFVSLFTLFLVTTMSLSGLSSRPLVVILMGPPASGKGTQAARLVKELNVPAISTGDLLRENRKNKTELGLTAESYIDKGELVPDQMVLAMLFQRISESDTKNGYLLDGFPRTVGQARAYEAHVGSTVRLLVINIDVTDKLLYERVKERAKREGRSDDTPAILEERLKNYRAQTAPLITYFSEEKILFTVDGSQPVDSLTHKINEIIQVYKQQELALR